MYTRKETPFNPATLSFSHPELEAAFRANYFEKNIRHLRLYLVLGFLLYGLFGFYDYWIIPHAIKKVWIIRYAAVCPFLLGTFAFSYRKNFQKVLQPAFFLAGFSAGAGIIAMILITSPAGNFTYYVGLLLCLLFYFRLRFFAASLLSWVIFALYETTAILFVETPTPILFSNTFILLSFIITGMFICYTLERYNRSEFLLQRTVQLRNHEISASNRALQQEILEHRQAVETKQLLEAQLYQARKMEALGRLAGGIAHEFTNILTAVVGYANYIQMKMDKDDPLHPYAGNIITSANRAARLTNDLLAFSRKRNFEPRVSNLNEIIMKTESFLPLVAGKKIRVSITTYEKPLIAMADEIMIQQILVNMVADSREAMPDGGVVTITVDLLETDRETVLDSGTMQPGSYARISAIEMGIGQDDITRSRTFEPYLAGKRSGKLTESGLTMIENTVKLHSGFIEIGARRGMGTTFRILLPLVAKAEKQD